MCTSVWNLLLHVIFVKANDELDNFKMKADSIEENNQASKSSKLPLQLSAKLKQFTKCT